MWQIKWELGDIWCKDAFADDHRDFAAWLLTATTVARLKGIKIRIRAVKRIAQVGKPV